MHKNYGLNISPERENEHEMPLTLKFKDLIKKRADKDPKFRRGLLIDAIEALINDDVDTCKIMLRSYINATIGVERLGKELGKQPKSLRGMLSERRNPLANNLSKIISYLLKRENVRIDELSVLEKGPVKI